MGVKGEGGGQKPVSEHKAIQKFNNLEREALKCALPGEHEEP